MSLNSPTAKASLSQLLYNLSAATGIDIKPQYLDTVLLEMTPHIDERVTKSIDLVLRVDVADDARRREAAAAMRQIADAIENPRAIAK